MKIGIGQNGMTEVREVYNPIELVTNSNETIKICMRDSGFEFMYEGESYHAKEGVITKIEKTAIDEIDGQLPQSPKLD
jgi:hypothetical protein|tara:strand:+ start:12242 stop:12475 length:234 start_codon:yes stop_codon:yes gene_type:complete